VSGEKSVAVAYSGGLDSSVVARCAMNHSRVVACSAYVDDAADSRRAEEGAASLGVELVARQLSFDSLSDALARLDLPFEATLMDKSLWCLYYWVAKCALDAGAGVLLLGQLADELFGGYAKYSEALNMRGDQAARTMMENDLREYKIRGRARDLAACKGFVQAKLPFEADKVVSFASKLPMSYRIRNGERKALLRRAAVLLGVPTQLASAPKKAAQYSSGIQKLVVGSHF
jgi:asparagine synthase (glutamine-hydrolysing)